MKKMILAIALPMLKAIGLQLKEADSDDVGNDDLAGAAIIYAADVTDAVLEKRDIPFPPGILLRGGKPAKDAASDVKLPSSQFEASEE